MRMLDSAGFKLRAGSHYRRFIAGPTLNNFKKKLIFFGNYHLMLLKFFEIKVNI